MSLLGALQRTLAAEHAALYVHGVLGGQTSRSAQPVLFSALEAAHEEHRARRDRLVAEVTAAGGEPVAAQPAYEVPTPLPLAEVLRRAREVEAACAASYAYLVGSSAGGTRGWAVAALTGAAVRSLAFGAEPVPLPGLGEALPPPT